MRLVIVWPQGSKLPVRISRTDPVSELAHLLRFVCHRNKKLVFFHNGTALDPRRTFQELGINHDQHITVQIVEKDGDEVNDQFEDPVRTEMLRLTDLRYQKRDSEMGVIPRREDSTSDETFDSPMVISAKPITIREDPLPAMWNDPHVKT